jgi:tetratricopeptide (TPR) repeat protein
MEIKSIKQRLIKYFRFWQWGLCCLIFILLIVNIITYHSLFNKVKVNILTNPSSAQAHLKLAEFAAAAFDWDLAKKELRLASDNLPINKNIENVSSYFEEVEKQVNIYDYLTAEINYWKQIIKEEPSYRDGYLQLSLLYYQIDDSTAAASYWQAANELDPNNNTVKAIGKLFEDNGLLK